jgi:eukaryotic-like serine/threonine-protein kinase
MDAVVSVSKTVAMAVPPSAPISDLAMVVPAPPVPAPAAPVEAAAPATRSARDSIDIPPGSDPEVTAAARAIARAVRAGADPEASLDIPPPSRISAPEERSPGVPDPYIGTTFDHRYKIDQLLGEGGMGFVYLARHKVIDKKVAVKVLRADLARNREILDRFLQEAKAASSIGNAHIIDISDFGDLPDGSTYFVMEYLEGKSLGELMEADERMPIDRICHISIQIADGLSAAHERGIIHRDLKPDNVFAIPRGADEAFVKILDFGIAKVSNSTTTKLTKAGAVFGTPHYMSPEQAAGAPVDHRTDIYALGVMLYEMVSGQLPFNADNFMGILTQHMYKAPVPIRALVPGPDCPPSLEAVVLKCLSKKPELRYQSMEELKADLERVRNGGVPHAVAEMMARSGGFNVPHDYFKQANAIVPATPPPQRKPWPSYVWIAGALAAMGLVTVIFVIGGSSKGGTPQTGGDKHAATSAPTATVASTAPAVAVTPSAVAPDKKKVSVSVVAFPATAMGYQGDAPVKLPAKFDVEDGQSLSLDVRADGYEPQTVQLDGKEDFLTVTLKPKLLHGGKLPGATSGGGKKSSGSGGDVLDPWATKGGG